LEQKNILNAGGALKSKSRNLQLGNKIQDICFTQALVSKYLIEAMKEEIVNKSEIRVICVLHFFPHV
jgi:hypothetical protein